GAEVRGGTADRTSSLRGSGFRVQGSGRLRFYDHSPLTTHHPTLFFGDGPGAGAVDAPGPALCGDVAGREDSRAGVGRRRAGRPDPAVGLWRAVSGLAKAASW